MRTTMRTLYALAAVVILGTAVYAQDKPKAGEKTALPNAQQDNGSLVRSLNTLQGNVTLQAGANVSITKAGNALTIAATSSQETAVDDFWVSAPAGWNAGSQLADAFIITVPVGKQLFVQHVSVVCEMPGADGVANTNLQSINNQNGDRRIHMLKMSHDPGSQNSWSTTQPISFYMNPGWTLHVYVFRPPSPLADPNACTVSVSGRFLPIP